MTLAELASGAPLDLAIIGGGINGCAIAEEAAARGLRVALFEQGDFGFGTTWRSTKLIHGGLRYLEHGDVGLVFESLQERAWLLRTRRHLVRPQRFVLPVLPWTRRPAWQLRAGLTMYDILSYERSVPVHRHLKERELRELAPFLAEPTRGGFTFYDARVLAPERLALELALEAEGAGAAIFNHAAVERVNAADGAVTSLRVRDAAGSCFEIPAKAVVNAAGPWVDAVNEAAGLSGPGNLGVTRGTHIVVELDGPPPKDAVFSTARDDGRVFFAVPQGKLLLVGTTDVRFDGAPGDVRPTAEEADYLLAEAGALLPGLGVTRERVRYAYAGLRPLQRVPGGPEAAITRRHAVIDHGRSGGPAGLKSVVGGKLSTFRPLAREVIAGLEPPRKRDSSRQDRRPPREQEWAINLLALDAPGASRSHLRIYGERAGEVVGLDRGLLCGHAGAVRGEVIHAARSEHASTLSDILMRRTGIAWAACRGLCCHREAAGVAGPMLGWDAAETGRQVAAFEADVAFHLPGIDSL
ncbi:MAG: glycerol-3-phosphate dehydrogenase/oxidase [Chloroflexi bacterium]|nr:glycerol-3-phosphate dehydrogenase/oxidase [Chloroflexota bacterium]